MLIASFEEIREKVDADLRNLCDELREELKGPALYALSGGGKRFRPLLVHFIAESIGKGYDVAPAAVAVELFHTASLLADDLPCMDDDDYRRGKLSTHKQYDEATALLLSYGFITKAFELIGVNGALLKKERADTDLSTQLAYNTASRCAGFGGAVLGQYLDLKGGGELEEMFYLKTGALFEGCFVLGYLFGGGDLGKVDRVRALATHLGTAFQIWDDLDDLKQDDTTQEANWVHTHGKEASIKRLNDELKRFDALLSELNLNSENFQLLLSFLQVPAL